jgi:hypothetical protein
MHSVHVGNSFVFAIWSSPKPAPRTEPSMTTALLPFYAPARPDLELQLPASLRTYISPAVRCHFWSIKAHPSSLLSCHPPQPPTSRCQVTALSEPVIATNRNISRYGAPLVAHRPQTPLLVLRLHGTISRPAPHP